MQKFHKPTAGTIDYREGHFRDNAKIALEQNNDPVLRNLRAKIEFNQTANSWGNIGICSNWLLDFIRERFLRRIHYRGTSITTTTARAKAGFFFVSNPSTTVISNILGVTGLQSRQQANLQKKG